MKTPTSLKLTSCLLGLSLWALPASAQVITGETVLNPYFENSGGDPDYSNWTLNTGWRGDDAAERLVFDVKSSGQNPAGYWAAIGNGKSGAQIAAENSLDPGSFSLSGFDFAGDPNPFFVRIGPVGDVGGSYLLYFEVDIFVDETLSFRAQSNQFNPITQAEGPMNPAFSWLSGGSFQGDPADQPGGGIPLSSITAINYTAVMWVQTPNPDGGFAFSTVDNMTLAYQVIPEPAVSGILLAAGLVFLLRRRSRGEKCLAVSQK